MLDLNDMYKYVFKAVVTWNNLRLTVSTQLYPLFTELNFGPYFWKLRNKYIIYYRIIILYMTIVYN